MLSRAITGPCILRQDARYMVICSQHSDTIPHVMLGRLAHCTPLVHVVDLCASRHRFGLRHCVSAVIAPLNVQSTN